MKLKNLKPIKRHVVPKRRTGSVKLLIDLAMIRKEKGITIRQVADAVKVSSGIVCQVENGCTPSIETALRFAAFLEISIEDIWKLGK